MKTSLEFITMELEYKRIMVNLKSTELEKLKVKMNELQVRYKYEVELRNELFNLLFSGPKGRDRAEIREKGEGCSEKRREKREELIGNSIKVVNDEEVRECREDRVTNGEEGAGKRIANSEEKLESREEVIEKSWNEEYDKKLAGDGEKKNDKSKTVVDDGQVIIKRRWLEGYGSEGEIDYMGTVGDTEEENWEFEGVRLPMDNLSIAQLRLNKDLAMLRYYSMKSSIENMKSEIEILRKVLIYFKDEIQEVQGSKKRCKWLN